MLRTLLATALLLSMLIAGAAPASAAAPTSQPAEQSDEPVQLPRTQAAWRERIQALTPGMTPYEVADAIGRAPDSSRKTAPGNYRLNYQYYIEGFKSPQTLFLYFTDGVYTRAQW